MSGVTYPRPRTPLKFPPRLWNPVTEFAEFASIPLWKSSGGTRSSPHDVSQIAAQPARLLSPQATRLNRRCAAEQGARPPGPLAMSAGECGRRRASLARTAPESEERLSAQDVERCVPDEPDPCEDVSVQGEIAEAHQSHTRELVETKEASRAAGHGSCIEPPVTHHSHPLVPYASALHDPGQPIRLGRT